MKHVVALSFVAVALVAGTALAQQDADIASLELFAAQLKGDLTQKRDSALSTMIALDGEQSKTFWAIVKDYDKEITPVRKEGMEIRRDFIRLHSSLNEANAAKLAARFFRALSDRNAVRRKAFDRLSKDVSPVAAMQFLQLQAQFETMADAKLSATMPLAGH